VAKTIKAHLWGILNAVVLKVSNGPAEGLNSWIKMIKFRSKGFCDKERFANATYFHFGGLALYPEGVVR
ncbi:MAG: transposase, partial [Candidatus Thiodiazotropha sp. (ex Lucinoma aequizonata)]|nr:transposase [Candidatus Thiodiazotropha sp. (ex Lucinoma aequizonata)]MCU7889997.1 transposase [Candidatus Thiodiazotropha sp. (ex Lucinoma aequizonata)]MCU7895333.1 transposase [Candidatus Thiodiazotropha sp. (ex Lucinoma aequizonata)]MCU7900112.1 transposase [Candidatus Thiodiazotropha sp. (ex Lucinoma aequizonata)]MCU7904101.1 transposase [Candidatus Thiodiazotropha sp. (ex Lucinoma aequizonata)]